MPFHFSLYEEFSDNTDELLRVLINRRYYTIKINGNFFLNLIFIGKNIA